MKRRSKPSQAAVTEATPRADAGEVLQIKVWLAGISPMIWRRILVPAAFSLRELHGVIQVAMGWEGIHLYQFCVRAARYGSWEVSAASPDATLAALRFRKGARFVYEYDLNIPWRHEVRIEDRLWAAGSDEQAGREEAPRFAGRERCNTRRGVGRP